MPDTARNADQHCTQGIELLASGSAVEAARAFRAAIEADFECVEAHHGLVRALCETGRSRQAVDVALALIILTPSDPLAHTALSLALEQAGLRAEAENATRRARVLEWKRQLEEPAAGAAQS